MPITSRTNHPRNGGRPRTSADQSSLRLNPLLRAGAGCFRRRLIGLGEILFRAAAPHRTRVEPAHNRRLRTSWLRAGSSIRRWRPSTSTAPQLDSWLSGFRKPRAKARNWRRGAGRSSASAPDAELSSRESRETNRGACRLKLLNVSRSYCRGQGSSRLVRASRQAADQDLEDELHSESLHPRAVGVLSFLCSYCNTYWQK